MDDWWILMNIIICCWFFEGYSRVMPYIDQYWIYHIGFTHILININITNVQGYISTSITIKCCHFKCSAFPRVWPHSGTVWLHAANVTNWARLPREISWGHLGGDMLENPKLFYCKSSHWPSHIRDFPAKTEAEQLFTGSLVRATIINTSPDGQFVWNQPSCHINCVDLHIFQCVWRVLRDTHICWWCWNAPSSFSDQKMNFQDKPIPPANPGHLS